MDAKDDCSSMADLALAAADLIAKFSYNEFMQQDFEHTCGCHCECMPETFALEVAARAFRHKRPA